MTYQVLARSYRPQSFEDLLGQEPVVRTLQNALAAGTVGHAYLFSGLRGVGKTTVARLLAKAVNCAQGPTPDPCGDCVSCQEIREGSSLDMVELDGASNRGIDDVRELRELLRYRPSRDRFRVIIIDEVHMLTREAFNALLKSLEEPPPHILFVLATTERHKVPATILSRCQQLEFRPIGIELLCGRVLDIAAREGFKLTRGAAETISRAAEGSVRDALSLLDQLRAFSGDDIDEDAVSTVLGLPSFELSLSLIQTLVAGDAAAGLTLLRSELAAGHDAAVLYRELGRLLRILVHLAVDAELEDSLSEDQAERLRPLASSLGADALSRMLGLWLEQEPLLRDTANRELALEVAALRLSRWPTVRRLERLLADPASSQELPDSVAQPEAVPVGVDPPEPTASSAEKPTESESPQASDISDQAAQDPQLQLAQQVLGGEIVAIRPDRENE
jgi:DNA polymerase-3 subunit gamma/tau